jgi:hypothetical protein
MRMLAMQMCPTIIETNRIVSIIRQSRTIKVEKGQELVNREKLSPKKHRQIEMCEIRFKSKIFFRNSSRTFQGLRCILQSGQVKQMYSFCPLKIII